MHSELNLNKPSYYSSSSNIPFNENIYLFLENVSASICPEFELNSNGIVQQLFPDMMGDYLLQSVRSKGRNIYRTKELKPRNNKTGAIYLYSFDADEYAEHEDYEKFKDAAGTWVVSFIKYSIVHPI